MTLRLCCFVLGVFFLGGGVCFCLFCGGFFVFAPT